MSALSPSHSLSELIASDKPTFGIDDCAGENFRIEPFSSEVPDGIVHPIIRNLIWLKNSFQNGLAERCDSWPEAETATQRSICTAPPWVV
jgi:hypothetical protein